MSHKQIMIIPDRDRFTGCLIGQCLGDALGFPVEGYPPHICKKYVNEILKTDSAGETGRGHFPFGQYTDDSQLARELLQSYVTCKEFDPRDYSKRIASIFSENRIVGRGRATEMAAQNLIKGIAWDKAGTQPPSAGNGSAMRAGPVGLLFFDDPESLVRAARDQGRITHQDTRCSSGAVAIAGAVALSLLMEEINSNEFIRQLRDWTRTIDRSFADSVSKLADWIKLPPEKAAQFIGKEGLDHSYRDNWHGISPFVTGSVLWSLYAFLRSSDDYRETICTAIAVGGDVDTTAAMAGAISGARLGLGAIPPHLAARLSDQGAWNYGDLIELANQCYDIKMKQLNSREQ